MIPAFNESGFLPEGVHKGTITEVERRFGRQSEIRRVQMESVKWMVDLALQAGVRRIVLNGSFVTDTMEPNDVDCVLLVGSGFPTDRDAEAELLKGFPFLDVSLVDELDFAYFVDRFFAVDRAYNTKGMVEVVA